MTKPVVRKEKAPSDLGYLPLVLRLRPVIELTRDQLLELSSLNKDLQLELTAKGELVVMPPEGTETGGENFELAGQLWVWTKRSGTGVAFDRLHPPQRRCTLPRRLLGGTLAPRCSDWPSNTGSTLPCMNCAGETRPRSGRSHLTNASIAAISGS